MSRNDASLGDNSVLRRLGTLGLKPSVKAVYHSREDVVTMALRATESASLAKLIVFVRESLPLSSFTVTESDIDSMEEVHISMPNSKQAWISAMSEARLRPMPYAFRMLAIGLGMLGIGILFGSNQ